MDDARRTGGRAPDQLSAARLVRRRKWRRQADNLGRIRILSLPLQCPKRMTDRISGRASHRHQRLDGGRDDAAGAAERLEAERTASGGGQSGMEAELDGKRRREDKLRGQLAAEKARADLLQAAMDQAIAEAKEQAEAMRRAEDARRVRGTWARLRVAWRGG